MARIKFEFEFDTETGNFSVVNTETGEVQEAKATIKKATSKKTTSKKVVDNDPEPKITLEENKYTLNGAAATLLLVEDAENRLEIKYMKDGNNKMVPVVTLSSSGNKVTKSNTVACRGKVHTELEKYGTEFILRPFPGKTGVYLMLGDANYEPLEGDENISIPTEATKPVVVEDDDLDLSDLITEEDETEVSSFNFSL